MGWEPKLQLEVAHGELRPGFTAPLKHALGWGPDALKKGKVSMLGMTRWMPWTELAGMHRDLDSLFNRVFGDTVRSQQLRFGKKSHDLSLAMPVESSQCR